MAHDQELVALDVQADPAPFVALDSAKQHALEASDVMSPCDDEASALPTTGFTSPLVASWIVSLLGAFQFGYSIGVTGAVNESVVFAGHSSFLWSVSVAIFPIGGLVGSLTAGPLADAWSRKRGMLVAAVIYIIAGVIMGCAVNIFMLIVGRFIVGVATGTTGVFVPLYLRELAPSHLRGTLGTGYQCMTCVGIWAVEVLGFAFSGAYHSVWQPGWRLLMGLPALIALVQILLLPLMHESPCWMVAAGHLEEATSSLLQLRGVSDVSNELKTISGSTSAGGEEKVSIMSVIHDQDPGVRRPLIVGVVLQVAQQFSGCTAVMFYANTFFENAGLKNPQVGTALFGTINIVGVLVALALMDRAGRRPLLLWSCTGMLVSALGLTLALLNCLPAATAFSIFFVLTFVASYELGLAPIPWLIVAEMMPVKPRATAMSLATTVNWLSTFIVGLIFPVLQSALNNCSFLPFAACLVLSLLFTLRYVPETKGKSVEEIREAMQ